MKWWNVAPSRSLSAVSTPTVWRLARHAARLLKDFCWVGAPSCHLITTSATCRKIFSSHSETNRETTEYFHQWCSYSSCSYFKPTKCKSDCRQLVLLAPAVRRVDKWPQAGGLLINCSSPYSSALSMSTHAPPTDIHLAISNLKSRQGVFIRVRWGEGGVGTLEDRAGTLWNFATNPSWPIRCI